MNTPAKPLIGITVGTGAQWRPGGSSAVSYGSAVERAGGDYVFLNSPPSRSFAKCDGLMIPGGWDVHPSRMKRLPGDENLTDEEIEAKYGIGCEIKRDETELPIIAAALERGIPILGICRGIQALHIVMDGRLIPDIPSCVPNALTHRSPGLGVSLSHEVAVEPGSVIEQAYGPGVLIVNTRHHQGLTRDMVCDQLKITAIAPDGVVEAVESKDSRFIVGVQWHPERQKDAFIHDKSGPLFGAFVRACAGGRQQ